MLGVFVISVFGGHVAWQCLWKEEGSRLRKVNEEVSPTRYETLAIVTLTAFAGI